MILKLVTNNYRELLCFGKMLSMNSLIYLIMIFPLWNACPSSKEKKGRVFYFDEDYFRCKQRHKQYQNMPPDHRDLRPNVEATMKEFVGKTKNHKLKVRGIFKARLFIYAAAVAINFGRIFRYLLEKGSSNGIIFIFIFIMLILGMMKGFIKAEWLIRDR